ncbi:MAG: lipase family protein [Eubacterium sp.]|nr:lipase family protein [Eubacterium sp.]
MRNTFTKSLCILLSALLIFSESVGAVEIQFKNLDNDSSKISVEGEYWTRFGTAKIPITLDEKAFYQDAYVYSHTLARFSMELSLMCYSVQKDESKNARREVYSELGFSKYQADEGKEDGSVSPYDIGYKNISWKGKKETVIVVAIRGAENEEWINNFDAGTSDTHKGFKNAGDYVYDGIQKYVNQNKTEMFPEKKILITGHSRGAAAANLVGCRLDDQGLQGTEIHAEDVYVYSYATPNLTTKSERNEKKYGNIFNIVNPEDFVTKVLPAGWNYGRYGITYVLPSKTTEGDGKNYVDYDRFLKSVSEKYKIYKPNFGSEYQPYELGTYPVNKYFKEMTKTIKDIDAYYNEQLEEMGSTLFSNRRTLQTLYTYTLGQFQATHYVVAVGYICLASLGLWGDLGRETFDYFVYHQVLGTILPTKTPDFQCAHTQEYYLAAMETITEDQLKQPRKQVMGIVNGTADITVKDEMGKLVGQIQKGQVNEDLNEIVMTIDGASKIFILPGDKKYEIEFSGNPSGNIDYSLCNMDADTGETERVFYNQLKMEQGQKYIQNVNTSKPLENQKLKNREDKIIEPSKVLEKKELCNLSVHIQTECNENKIQNQYNLTCGDLVTLKAKKDWKHQFLGWYNQNNQLVSKKETLNFTITKNEKIIARYRENDSLRKLKKNFAK